MADPGLSSWLASWRLNPILNGAQNNVQEEALIAAGKMLSAGLAEVECAKRRRNSRRGHRIAEFVEMMARGGKLYP